MKILLLNDNPVVNKLVTLSVQKTSGELDIVQNIDDIVNDSYDLVVVDDGIGGDEALDELRKKLTFSKSLYICVRDAHKSEKFDTTLKKPFLPTDLIELFAMYEKEIEKCEELLERQSVEGVAQESLDTDDTPDPDELDETLIDEESLDDENLGESVLDDEEAQKVKDLLDETTLDTQSSFEFDLHAASTELGLALDIVGELVGEFIEQADSHKEELYASVVAEDFDKVHEIAHKLKGVAANLRIEDVSDMFATVNRSTDATEILEKLDQLYGSIGRLQNEMAVEDMSEASNEESVAKEHDLALDDEAVPEIAAAEIDTLDSLSSKDLKLALGEETSEASVEDVEDEEKIEGIEALKKLLEALNNKDVAASIKGMKITINIELDNK